jgi:hypothetical protein
MDLRQAVDKPHGTNVKVLLSSVHDYPLKPL